MNRKHVGSSFDDFLAQEGLLTSTEVSARKRVLTWQLREAMKEQGVSIAELARRMGSPRVTVQRLLDDDNDSATLRTMHRAADALGKVLHISLANAPRRPSKSRRTTPKQDSSRNPVRRRTPPMKRAAVSRSAATD